jgi:hypothetical protein
VVHACPVMRHRKPRGWARAHLVESERSHETALDGSNASDGQAATDLQNLVRKDLRDVIAHSAPDEHLWMLKLDH